MGEREGQRAREGPTSGSPPGGPGRAAHARGAATWEGGATRMRRLGRSHHRLGCPGSSPPVGCLCGRARPRARSGSPPGNRPWKGVAGTGRRRDRATAGHLAFEAPRRLLRMSPRPAQSPTAPAMPRPRDVAARRPSVGAGGSDAVRKSRDTAGARRQAQIGSDRDEGHGAEEGRHGVRRSRYIVGSPSASTWGVG